MDVEPLSDYIQRTISVLTDVQHAIRIERRGFRRDNPDSTRDREAREGDKAMSNLSFGIWVGRDA